MARKQTVIQRFDGGISDDIRQQSANSFAITQHFDIYSNPNRLTPFRSSEADTNDGSTETGMKQYEVRNFLLGSDNKLYGLGKQASFSRRKIFSKADPTTGNWTLEATAEGNTTLIYDSFIEWGTTKALWMFSGTTNVSKWTIGGTFTNTVATIGTITTTAPPVIGSDDNLYMFYNNKVVRVSPAGAVTDAVLSLPATGRITSACNYGKYLAITWVNGTTNLGSGKAYVYLWDMVSADISERVDWGDGVLQFIIGNVDGNIIGVSDDRVSSSMGVGGGKYVIRVWNGGSVSTIKEIKNTSTITAGLFRPLVTIRDNKMYWAMSAVIRGVTQFYGVWAVGKNKSGQYVVTVDHIETTNANGINGFAYIGNYMFIAHSADGSITKTNDQATYTATSIYETQKFNGGDINATKKLIGAAVSTAPLPTAGQVVLKFKADAETSWTTISTTTTDNSVSVEDIIVRGTGQNLPEYNEIQFRIESTGGAEITGLKFVYEEKKTLLNLK